jgi:hypothetical protein
MSRVWQNKAIRRKNSTMKMKSWWSLNAAEWEAMKRLEFEPELRDRGKRHKGLSFGTLFKLWGSLLTENGSWEQKTHFRSSHFPSSAPLTHLMPISNLFQSPVHFDRKWEGLQVKVSLLNPVYLNSIALFPDPFSLLTFLRQTFDEIPFRSLSISSWFKFNE